MRTALLSILVFVLVGCDTEELIYSIPHDEPKVVVNFVGVNAEVWYGEISMSMPVLEYNYPYVEDALVNLYEDGEFLETLTTSPDGPGYQSENAMPRPGHEYTIEVIVKGQATATATYTQPSLVVPSSFEVVSRGPYTGELESIFPDGAENLEFHLSFKDSPGEDFYEVFVMAFRDSSYSQALQYGLESADQRYVDLESRFQSTGAFLFDDRLFDGQDSKMVFKTIHPYVRDYFSQEVITKFKVYWVEIRHYSKEHFNYITSMWRQIDTNGDPYAQPVRVSNNINNGLGNFSGYTRSVSLFVNK